MSRTVTVGGKNYIGEIRQGKAYLREPNTVFGQPEEEVLAEQREREEHQERQAAYNRQLAEANMQLAREQEEMRKRNEEARRRRERLEAEARKRAEHELEEEEINAMKDRILRARAY